MATLTVWKFASAGGAEEAVRTLERLQGEELVQIHDAAVVEWPSDKKKPKTHRTRRTSPAPVRWAVRSGGCSSA